MRLLAEAVHRGAERRFYSKETSEKWRNTSIWGVLPRPWVGLCVCEAISGPGASPFIADTDRKHLEHPWIIVDLTADSSAKAIGHAQGPSHDELERKQLPST